MVTCGDEKMWTDSRDVQVAKSRDSGDGWDVGGVDEGGVRMMAMAFTEMEQMWGQSWGRTMTSGMEVLRCLSDAQERRSLSSRPRCLIGVQDAG